MKIIFLGIMSLLFTACASVHALDGKRNPSSYEGYYTSAEEVSAQSRVSLADAIVKARQKCDAKVTDNAHYNVHDIVLTNTAPNGTHDVVIVCMVIAK